jgi:hypothetical protein
LIIDSGFVALNETQAEVVEHRADILVLELDRPLRPSYDLLKGAVFRARLLKLSPLSSAANISR